MKAEIRHKRKRCRKCLKWKPLEEFGTFIEKRRSTPARYFNSRCKLCATNAVRTWVSNNTERVKLRLITTRDALLSQIRFAYGDACACCGECRPLFLTIDHKNNDGFKLRTRNGGKNQGPYSIGYYRSIVTQGFPPDLQLLCWNCNCGRSRNGGVCPHNV